MWKGKFDTLPAVASYEAGNVIGVGNKEYVLTVTGDTKAWVEFGDEGSYLLKSTAEFTYLKKNDASTTYAPKSHTHTKSQITDFPTIPTVNDAKVTIKMNGSEKGNFTLNQSSTKEIDLGTVITQHQDISGKLDKAKLTPILKEIDLTGTDAERKAKLDQFEADWKALTGSDSLNGARFVGNDGSSSALMVYSPGNAEYEGVFGGSIEQVPNRYTIATSDGSLTITPLFQHLEAITIYTDNTSEHMQANLDNIAAYEANLQALGVDTTKSPMIPIHIPDDDGIEIYSGFVIGNPSLQTYYSGYIEKESTPGRVYKGILIDGGLVYLTTFADQNNVVDKSLNVKSLESVVIYTDNTIEHKSQNIKNIQAYEANLKSLGVDTANGFEFLGLANGYNIHFVKSRNSTYQFFGIQTYNEENYTTWINTDGRYTESSFSNLYTSRSLNAKSLEAVTIKTSNSDADKAANVAAIKAYVDNLKSLGVDVTNREFIIPFVIQEEDFSAAGYVINTYKGDGIYTGVYSDNENSIYRISIDPVKGIVYSYTLQQVSDSFLTTTSKQIVGAINEVNAAVKTKANSSDVSSKQDKLVSGTNIKTVNGQSLLGSGDITVSGGKKSVTIPITGVETTLTSIQVTAFKDPNTNIIISMDAGVLPTDIYSYDDSGNVVYRVYAGTLLAASGVAVMQFRVEDSKLIYTFANLSANTPVNDTDVANKKYVDDQITAKLGTVLTQLQSI